MPSPGKSTVAYVSATGQGYKQGDKGAVFVQVSPAALTGGNQPDKVKALIVANAARQQKRHVEVFSPGAVKPRTIDFKKWPVSAGNCVPSITKYASQKENIPGVGTVSDPLLDSTEGAYLCQAPIAFYEQENPAREHDYRIFIEGVEVSAYVRGSASWTTETTGGMNTARFTLNNNQDAFIITPLNVCSNLSLNGWRVDPSGLISQVAHGEPRYDELAKYLLYKRKFERVAPNSKSAEIDPETGMWLYPLSPYGCIINKHDTVRIWKKLAHVSGAQTYKNVNGKKVARYYDLWAPAFTGLVRAAPYDDDYVTGDRFVSVDCYDYRGLMERMRVRTVGLPMTGQKDAALTYFGPGVEEISTQLGRAIEAVVFGVKTPQRALDEAAPVCQGILDRELKRAAG